MVPRKFKKATIVVPTWKLSWKQLQFKVQATKRNQPKQGVSKIVEVEPRELQAGT